MTPRERRVMATNKNATAVKLHKYTMTQGRYLVCFEQPNGLLFMLLPEGREYLADANRDRPDFDLFADLFEDFAGNGWSMFQPQDIGALTDCRIIISPDAEFDDNGDVVDAGQVFWHERYQLDDAIEELLAGDLFLLAE